MTRLQEIFSEGYGYNLEVFKIPATNKAQLSLNIRVAQHVVQQDGENTLLIVVYHGACALVQDGSKYHGDLLKLAS